MPPSEAGVDLLKPGSLEVIPENIPAELKVLPQWLVWRYELRQDSNGIWKWTKPPFMARDPQRAGSSTDPDTWATFDEALATYQSGKADGIGLVPLGEGPYAAVDLDKSRDPETGTVREWAERIIDELATYTEVSPSRTGFRLFLKARLKVTLDGESTGRNRSKTGDFEVYDGLTTKLEQGGRYLTVTGHCLNGHGIKERQLELEHIYDRMFDRPKKAKYPQATGSSDADLVEQIKASNQGPKFSRLWAGDTSEYAKDNNDGASEADLALCCILAFWTNKDRARMDGLFRQSGLYRAKWERSDYRERTLNAACEMTSETYGGGSGGFVSESPGPSGEEEPWGAIQPLPPKREPVPSLPADMVPEPLRAWLVDAAERTSLPLELYAAPALVTLAAVVGCKIGIRPRKFDDWLVVPNLWGAIVGRPGIMKSAAVGEAMRFLAHLEATAKEEYDRLALEAEVRREVLEAEIAAIKRQLRGSRKERQDE